jgi:hypothetical protein
MFTGSPRARCRASFDSSTRIAACALANEALARCSDSISSFGTFHANVLRNFRSKPPGK